MNAKNFFSKKADHNSSTVFKGFQIHYLRLPTLPTKK